MHLHVMGIEQNFDSDSLESMQGTNLESFNGFINQPISIVMDSNKLVSKTPIKQVPVLINNTDNDNRFFLFLESSNMVQGYRKAMI
jgi:hypothetical protein